MKRVQSDGAHGLRTIFRGSTTGLVTSQTQANREQSSSEMSELTELNLIQLKQSVRVAARPAADQIASFPNGVDVEEEIAIEFDAHCRWALEGHQAPDLTPDQRSSLVALDTRLDLMSGKQNADLWTDEALRTRPEWEEVRRDARKILEAFGWSLEEQ